MSETIATQKVARPPRIVRFKVHGQFTRGGRQEATVEFTVPPPTKTEPGKPAEPERPVVMRVRVKHERSELCVEFDQIVEMVFSREAKQAAARARR